MEWDVGDEVNLVTPDEIAEATAKMGQVSDEEVAARIAECKAIVEENDTTKARVKLAVFVLKFTARLAGIPVPPGDAT